MFEVGAEDVMAVLDLLQGGVEFALQLLGEVIAKNLGDLVGGQPTYRKLSSSIRSESSRSH